MEGAYGAAVLTGLGCLRASGRGVRVNPGIAVSPTGKLMYHVAFQNYSFTAPVSLPERALLVMRPKITNTTPITSPIDPNSTVNLKALQGYEIVGIRGVESLTPEYPAKGADDVILCGVYLNPSFNFDGNADIDFAIRDMPMKNATGLDVHGIWDDRLRPYKTSYKAIGIKPAIQGDITYMGQANVRNKPLGFSYIKAGKKSLFPRDTFNGAQNVDTFVDMETGVISGGYDDTFTPVIPEAGKYQLATVCLGVDDKIFVFYPTPSFSYNSKSGVFFDINDGLADAPAGYKGLCHLILAGEDGTTVSDIQVFDIRHPGNVVTADPGALSGESVLLDANELQYFDSTWDGKTLLCDFSALSDGTYVYLAQFSGDVKNAKWTIKDVGGNFSRLTVQIGVSNGATMKIEGQGGMYLEADYGAWTFKADNVLGRNYWIV